MKSYDQDVRDTLQQAGHLRCLDITSDNSGLLFVSICDRFLSWGKEISFPLVLSFIFRKIKFNKKIFNLDISGKVLKEDHI